MIDTDGATNGLTLLHLKEVMNTYREFKSQEIEPIGIYQTDVSSKPADVVELGNGVHLIPATYKFIDTDSTPSKSFHEHLKLTISAYNQSYDYIFIDAQAGSDEYSRVGMSRDISDEVLIISEYDPMSAAGVERLKSISSEELTYERTWILLNKMLPDFIKSFSDFLEIARYLSPVPWNKDVVLAYARRRLALDFEVGNEYTLAITRTLQSLLGDEISSEIDEWNKKAANLLRQPIEEQYKSVQFELDSLAAKRRKLKEKNRSLLFLTRNLSTFLFTLVFVVGYYFFETNSNVSKFLSPYPSWVLLVVIASLIPLAAEFFSNLAKTSLKSSKDVDVDEERIKRQQTYLMDKLEYLNSLRDAELEELIKSRKSSDS